MSQIARDFKKLLISTLEFFLSCTMREKKIYIFILLLIYIIYGLKLSKKPADNTQIIIINP